jgi:hypothetical protein
MTHVLGGVRRTGSAPLWWPICREGIWGKQSVSPERYAFLSGLTRLVRVWREAAERPVPGYVEEELRGYLECGILCFGFARALCTGCGQAFVVAFSCKGRGVCPSCNGRHMAQTAAHLVDHVIPPVPVRQWVISVPKRRRSR